jgi:hypothetical protein
MKLGKKKIDSTPTPKMGTVEDLDLMGSFEVAEHLGIKRQNVSGKSVPKGLPEPIAYLRATRVWLGSEIRTYALLNGYPRSSSAASSEG